MPTPCPSAILFGRADDPGLNLEGYVQQHDETWIRHLAAHGYPDAHPLGAGMEGAVYALHDDLVAKVWGDRSSAELERLRLFYADLSRAGLTFATPYIERFSARTTSLTAISPARSSRSMVW